MEATGSAYVSDGEQRASSFATYPITDRLAGTGLAENLAGGSCRWCPLVKIAKYWPSPAIPSPG